MLGAAAMLVACGGGGSSATANASAEGVWTGTNSSGGSFTLLVLENGDFYSGSITTTSGVTVVRDLDIGSSTISGNTLNGSLTEYSGTSVVTGTLNATVVTGTSIKGSATNTAGTQGTTFSATPLSTGSSGYNYNAAAKISDVIGNWSGTLLDGSTASISIASAGDITGTNLGCTFTGTAVPRASGKNVFDMSVKFGPSPCQLPGSSATGIAVNYDLGNGKLRLFAGLQDSSKVHGYTFLADR